MLVEFEQNLTTLYEKGMTVAYAAHCQQEAALDRWVLSAKNISLRTHCFRRSLFSSFNKTQSKDIFQCAGPSPVTPICVPHRSRRKSKSWTFCFRRSNTRCSTPWASPCLCSPSTGRDRELSCVMISKAFCGCKVHFALPTKRNICLQRVFRFKILYVMVNALLTLGFFFFVFSGTKMEIRWHREGKTENHIWTKSKFDRRLTSTEGLIMFNWRTLYLFPCSSVGFPRK